MCMHSIFILTSYVPTVGDLCNNGHLKITKIALAGVGSILIEKPQYNKRLHCTDFR